MITLRRYWPLPAMCALVVLVYLSLSLLYAAVAHAQTVEAPPATAVTLTLPELVGVVLAVLLGSRMVLRGVVIALEGIAPRTATTIDDWLLGGARKAERRVTEIIDLFPRTPVPLPAKKDGAP